MRCLVTPPLRVEEAEAQEGAGEVPGLQEAIRLVNEYQDRISWWHENQ